MNVIQAKDIKIGNTISIHGAKHTVKDVMKMRLDTGVVWLRLENENGELTTSPIDKHKNVELWVEPQPSAQPRPNPFQLSDNFTELRTVHEMDDALEAYDAEFWANQLKDEPIQQTKRDYAKAMHHGLNVSWPISGDTIAAIRATA